MIPTRIVIDLIPPFCGLLRRQLRVERPSQVAVVDGFANRILLFDRQAECRRDEAAHGSTADDECLLRHDVEPVARIVVAPFEIEQLFGHACAVVASPHENDDLLGTEPPVDRLLDPFDQRRIPGEGLDADVPFVAALFAGALCVRRVGFGERTSQLRGERLGDFVNDFTEDQVYKLTDVGNGPSMFYIMRNIKWQGVE